MGTANTSLFCGGRGRRVLRGVQNFENLDAAYDYLERKRATQERRRAEREAINEQDRSDLK